MKVLPVIILKYKSTFALQIKKNTQDNHINIKHEVKTKHLDKHLVTLEFFKS